MSSKSTIEKVKRIEREVAKYKDRREQLKKEGDYAALQKLPRNSSKTRLKTICALTGRTRSVYRKFRLSRIKLRELALEGKIPGMRKSSW